MQRPLKNIEGQRFGKLLVIGPSFRKNKETKCPCLCDCGNNATIKMGHLKSGNTKSCGCVTPNLVDRTGKKYGLLTVKEKVYENNKLFYKCLCDCGNERLEHYNFFWGIDSSRDKYCKEEVACSRYCILLLHNNYEIIPDPNGAYVLFELTRGQWAKCGIDDWFTYLNKYKWYASLKSTEKNGEKRFYVNSGNKGEHILMHRLILGLTGDDKRVADHRNYDTLDNRKSNIRIATHTQNAFNHKKSSANTSGLIGVGFDIHNNSWTSNGGGNWLGRFKDKIEAAKARDMEVLRLHIDFAVLNFPELREHYLKKLNLI